MSIFYKEGEVKKRPGLYKRYENAGQGSVIGSQDGICAIPIQACWGPLGKVLKNSKDTELYANYGSGAYGANNTVPAAAAMFAGGASIVYTYRMGTGGTAGTYTIVEGLTATAKYVGTLDISIAIKEVLSDATKKQIQIYVGTALVETFTFAADKTNEGANLIAATADSKYVTITGEAATVPTVDVASGKLTGGANPTVTNESYSAAYAALEPYYYNTIAIDVDDDESMTKSHILQSYLDTAFEYGKYGIGVYGQKTTVAFATRCANAKAFNDEKAVFLGGGYYAGAENKDGVLAICYTAGVIASTPSNQGITHAVIKGATDLCESLTHTQYEDAIASGMLMVSVSTDGLIWYDSGVNTLIVPADNQDEGWKKIRRVKVRFEAFDRLDRTLEPKVGRVSADSDGSSDVIQAGQRVLDAMAKEGKLMPGPVFQADPNNPLAGDSAWYLIDADDIDSLEKIYLLYRFRYSQQS